MKTALLNKEKTAGGFMILEVIMGVALAAIILLAFTTLIYKSLSMGIYTLGSLKAQLYASEMVEVARELERSNWAEISSTPCTPASPCHPEENSGLWTIISGTEALDSSTYTRSFYVEDVYRNQAFFPNEIVTTGGVDDPNTKKIVATVLWNNSGAIETFNTESYIYNYP